MPIDRLRATATLWMVPYLSSGIFYNNFQETAKVRIDEELGITSNVEFAMSVTNRYGGLKKRDSKWGIVGSLGLALRFGGNGRGEEDAVVSIVPTVLVDVAYALNSSIN